MKIALLHLALLDGPQNKNLEKLYRGIEVAVKHGASIIITPEMSVQGYRMFCTGNPFSLYKLENAVTEDNYEKLLNALDTEASRKRLQAVREKYGVKDEDGVNTDSLLKITEANRKNIVSDNMLNSIFNLARKYNVNIILGCGVVDSQGPHNSALLINNQGVVCGYHHKIKVVKWITEEWAAAGKNLKINVFAGIKLGLLVCADTWFEEHGEAYNCAGAELMVTVAAWPNGGCGGPPQEAWKRTSKAANGLPLIVCNQTGKYVMDCTKAQSALIEKGETVCLYSGEEAVLICEYDRNASSFISKEFDVIPFN